MSLSDQKNSVIAPSHFSTCRNDLHVRLQLHLSTFVEPLLGVVTAREGSETLACRMMPGFALVYFHVLTCAYTEVFQRIA